MRLDLLLEVDDDGRWIADALAFPGCAARAHSPAAAAKETVALVFRAIADAMPPPSARVPPEALRLVDVHEVECLPSLPSETEAAEGPPPTRAPSSRRRAG